MQENYLKSFGAMSMTTVELLEAEAPKLSQGDRSGLVERLVASLDEDKDIEAEWDAAAED